MSRQPRWLPLATLVAAAAIVFTACSGAATPAPSAAAPSTAASAPASVAASASAAASFTATTYPQSGEAPCGQAPYTGEFKTIKAIDAKTVEFDLCSADVAFLSKIAFASFPINDSAYLQAHVADKSILDHPNGTGPYMLKEWVKGDHITLEANPNYTGDQKPLVPTVVFKWSSEAAQRLVELQSGNADVIDNVGPEDFDTVKGNSDLKLVTRDALNVFYIGMNNTYKPFDNEKVRQAVAMGIDRKRIVDQFYPPGSSVADYFTPCAILGGCEGPKWYDFDKDAAKKLLADAGYPNGFSTTIHLRDVVRGYLPHPKEVAADIQAQLKTNLNITAKIDIQESGTYLDNASAGKLDGIHLLGWGADYPDQTDFVDYHFGAGASKQFGKHYPDLEDAIKTGATTPDDTARKTAYAKVNELIKQHVPMMPVAHGGSALGFRADVEGGASSPLSNEITATMKPDGRDQLVFIQNGEPSGLYCADEEDGEALRICIQMTQSLYDYKLGGTETIPNLATECKPNADLTVWTCTLKDGVKFADGSDLDANDVVTSYAAWWDAKNPLHVGRTNDFTYFSSLFGGFLNPPPPSS